MHTRLIEILNTSHFRIRGVSILCISPLHLTFCHDTYGKMEDNKKLSDVAVT